MATFLDKFDRGNQPTLGPGWREASNGFSIIGNSAAPERNARNLAASNTLMATNSHFAEMRIGLQYGGSEVGVAIYMPLLGTSLADTDGFYTFVLTGTAGRDFQIRRHIDFSTSFDTVATGRVDTDVRVLGTRIELRGNVNSSGRIELRGFVNGALVASYTATGGLVPTTNRRIGMYAAGADAQLLRIAQFSGGDWTAVVPTVPAVPTNLVATPSIPGRITIAATASAGATYYEFFRSLTQGVTGDKIATRTAPDFKDDGLAASTTYWYSIRAGNETGVSATSAQVSATTVADPPPPTEWFIWNGSDKIPATLRGVWDGDSEVGIIRWYVFTGETPIETVNPTPVVVLTRDGNVVTVDVTGSTDGSAPITSHRITWGDGTAVQTITEPTRTVSHTYAPPAAGITYTLLIEAIAAADGGVGTYSTSVTFAATPTPQPIRTIVGYNTLESDNFNQTLAGRQSKWGGRAPSVRRYSGASFNLNGGVFNLASRAPEKRLCYSVKGDGSGSYTYAGLAAGNGNSMLTDWCESVPAGFRIDFVPLHEPNDNIRNGELTGTQFRNIFSQFRTAIDNATLAAGTVVNLVSNFMAYRVAETPTFFSDSWVPPEADIMTMDGYGNPGEFTSQTGTNRYGTATGDAYGTTYSLPEVRFADMFEAIERNGYADSWGILEVNTPRRSWDLTETSRAQWLVDTMELFLNPPMTGNVPPKMILIWEAPSGVNWDQEFKTNQPWNALAPYVINSP